MAALGVLEMARKKRPVGRPKAEKPLKTVVSLKASEDFGDWMDELLDHAHQGTRALLMRNALRVFAEQSGFAKPQPKR